MERILVVDDNAGVRQLLLTYLTQEGYEVDTAANGEEALEKAIQAPFSLVLLDAKMPKLDGLQTAVMLKAQFPELPIFIITGYSDHKDLLEAIEKNLITGCVSKPFSLPDLLDFIKPAMI